jgi:Domain of unknown function (DUF1963)
MSQEHRVVDVPSLEVKNLRCYGESDIVLPGQLVFANQLRRTIERDGVDIEKLPVDVFLWARGEPSKPYLTKFGGVPYLSRDSKWPVSKEGAPYTFVCQMCFIDSADIIKQKLPGITMLVFFKNRHTAIGCDPSEYVIVWSKAGLSKEEMFRSEDIPDRCFSMPSLYGVIWRSYDVVIDEDALEILGEDKAFVLEAAAAFKIGGNISSSVVEKVAKLVREDKAVYLGEITLPSFGPGVRNFLIDQDDPMTEEESKLLDHDYMFGDGFAVEVVLKGDGTVVLITRS